ncbi:D-alanyl-D-alanine endopeptidase (penicillin-binding protein 7) [Natronocella acetinitrilica]|uniref:D-alanyl-D-alanine endopeptidase (Penicillin-binding protein 7) n=1 Tax=Natronocella acetinitrilica TaxID=414046 RepID=A0AAE3KD89_9GAMM|nr:D-alanyl-D-alanine endopeptidase [Natronocella acetinitrilica]MCP1675978.1 D-alanyl-D-alanine endopeptidase (penicillin-binding protein 7) [Natronocella acetinitrilica]
MTKRILLLLLTLLLMAATTAPATGNPGNPQPGAPALASVSAVAMDIESGEIVVDKRGDWQRPIASLTKLMTALVIVEAEQDLGERLRIVPRDYETDKNAYSRIRIDSELDRGALMRIMLMSSENLAAHVLSVNYPGGRDGFIKAMNDKARTLGMQDTRFVDASGLSPDNVSTARDLALLAKAAHQHPILRAHSTSGSYSAQFTRPRYALGYGNTNPLIANANWNVTLSKTGYLVEAGRCLVMVADVDGRETAFIMLDSFGTRTPLGDAARIRRWLTTGESGNVAAAARNYEQSRVEAATIQSRH